MDYKNGKIYAIRSYQTDDIYIGSTCSPLSKRFYEHKKCYERYLKCKYENVSSFEIIKYEDAYIELIEKYPCNDKTELRKREGEYIRQMECVNKVIPGRKRKEWRKDNRDKIKQQNKQYKIDNKHNIKQYGKQYYETNKNKIKEKYETNKKLIKEKRKQYYENNKKLIKEKRSEKYICICGITLTKNNFSRHNKSMKHKMIVFNLHNELNHLE